MSETILQTKLFAPKWPANLVTRPRLVARISEGVKHKLTVVSAPAGSGKTTLLAEWLAQLEGSTEVAWVSLDAGDNEPALFWTYLIHALRKAEPELGHAALTSLPNESSPTVQTLTGLLNEIAASDAELTLVLDDYHIIETPAIHTALAFFLDHLPPNLHVVLATRADPVLPLARMRAGGEVTELHATDLRFNPDEASTFLNQHMTLGLAAQDVAELENRTEGWIAGLKLAALSMQHHSDVSGFIRSFSGGNRYVADYLIEEVLQAQSERTRRFLLATSILDRLSASLCDAVIADTGSQSVLEMLEKSNLFVVPLDDRREWYRYHHLFAEVLQARSQRDDPNTVLHLHQRASLWFEQNGFLSDAVKHAQQAEDTERVAALLEQNWPPNDRSHETRRWLERVRTLPSDIVRARPMLNMGFAWALLNAGELEAADARISDVEASLDEIRFPTLKREVATARLYHAQSRGDTANTIERAQFLLTLVPDGDHMVRATASALLALAQWGNGQLDGAHDTFASALQSMRQAGAELDAIRGEFVLGDIRAAQGRLRDAMRIYEAGLSIAAKHPQAETDELYLGLSEVHFELGELNQAQRLLLEMEEMWSRAAHVGNSHRWCAGMSRLAFASGDTARALELLTQAESTLRRDPLPVTRPFPAQRARIWIATNNIVNAERWAKEARVTESDELSFIREYEHITLARMLVAQNKLEQGSALLDRLMTSAVTGGRLGSVVEILMLQALVQQRLRNTAPAMDAISSALEPAEPQGYVRVFLDEGLPMRDLLRQATARGVAGQYTRKILAAFDESLSESRVARPVQLLTSRELEILRLIAAGMRNQEIANQLFISPATVKRHIANVYNKLNATHRTEALKHAGALNLL